MPNLLVELVTEELPPRSLSRLGATLAAELLAALVAEEFVAVDAPWRSYCTPRRLALWVADVAGRQPDREETRRGPALAAGLDSGGAPTRALEGFARSCGVVPEALEQGEFNGGQYFFFRSHRSGATLDERLAPLLEQALRRLPAPKTMRWASGEEQFIRPVHHLLLLHGERVVPGTVLGLDSGRQTLGHRFMGQGRLDIADADAWAESLATAGRVMADFGERRKRIVAGLIRAAGDATVVGDDALFDEVAALVEWPTVLEGRFDPAFLEVPAECLILSMQQHQRYFPLRDAGGALLPRFLLVSNMAPEDPSAIIAGNERVLRARLSDARFFFNTDRRTPLADRVPALGQVVHHNRLGSVGDRVERLVRLSTHIAASLGLDVEAARRAARLAKADLLTEMVGEFPELQGIMGRYYALSDGEDSAVASAIAEHYQPRFAGDALPASPLGQVLSLADRLDALTGFFGIGQAPTGDKDPFALRRQALGVVRLLTEAGLSLDLPALLAEAAAGYPTEVIDPAAVDDVLAFLRDRQRHALRDAGHDPRSIEAVLALAPRRLDEVQARLEAVTAFQALPEAARLAAANKRIVNILRKAAGNHPATIRPELLVETAERQLHQRMTCLAPAVESRLQAGDHHQALALLAGMAPEVDAFFDGVMVMAEDADLRGNRLALLAELARLMNGVADISALA